MPDPVPAVLALGSVGGSGLMGASCRGGTCYRQLRAELISPLSARLDDVVLHSARDGILDHGHTPDSGARIVGVDSSHVGYFANLGV
jgi:hypothetical protein